MKDNLAITCSGLCLIHCLLTPLILIVGIGSGVASWLQEEWIHYLLLIPVVILALVSLPYSFYRHRSLMPIVAVSVGFAAMIASFYLPESYEAWIMVPSSLCIISAHIMNKRLLFKASTMNIGHVNG